MAMAKFCRLSLPMNVRSIFQSKELICPIVTVTATSTTAGTAVVENVSKGTTVTHTFTSQSQALQELNAEWIVEDFESGNALVPFADFGTVTFTGASATTGMCFKNFMTDHPRQGA